MFARFLEITVKAEKKQEFVHTIRLEVLPILKKYTGFFDIIPLEVEAEPNKFFFVSLWTDKLDAQRYEKEYFMKVKQILEPFLVYPPVVKFCKVDTTLIEKFLTVAA